MKLINKLLVILSSLMLIGLFFFPLWSIDLQAPQYPEGIGMRIWINTVTGLNANDLNTINGLNHYIGMKEITPDSIPELRVMPAIIIALILVGLLSGVLGDRKILTGWIIGFIFIGIAGMADFYKWGYDYGRNLNPNAPIKVPNMTYQPPMIGTKQLLNISATSLPDIGAVLILISISITLYVVWNERRKGV